MASTVIAHIYNEEYILPWWLEHHKKIFDHGIIIDYASTDKSLEIIKEICPTWEVVQSKNAEFNARLVDVEVLEYERKIEGWRICLNVTEFLVGDYSKFLVDTIRSTQHLIPTITFWDWNPDGELDKTKPLWEQKKQGIHYKTDFMARRARSLHNVKTMEYDVGRHFASFNNEEMMIFHYANCIASKGMLDRRLQIQTKVPEHDRIRGWGSHHYHGPNGVMTADTLKELWSKDLHKATDCSEDIVRYTKEPDETYALDLGCGEYPKNPFKAKHLYGIDVRDDTKNKITKADLVIQPIPFIDNFFDYVTAHDFIEHIPRLMYSPNRRYPFVELMSEIWRVLKVGGKFYSKTPAFPHAAAFWDPRHVNIITEQTFPFYFDNERMWAKEVYGFKGQFKIESQTWDGPHLLSTLVKC